MSYEGCEDILISQSRFSPKRSLALSNPSWMRKNCEALRSSARRQDGPPPNIEAVTDFCYWLFPASVPPE